MLKIGITGGIGSGKTTVCKLFETLGIPVYYADGRAKELMNTDMQLKALLQERFGATIYVDGQLNRNKLAALIFNNKENLQTVNGWVHPAVARDFEKWCHTQHAQYAMEESAILFEHNLAALFDKVILVTAPENLRIERVCRRDAVRAEAVRQRMNNQWSEEKKKRLADFIIHNDDENMLIPQILEIHRQLTTA
ncbi:MAG: dephospho-CoA kinase [Bacteroidales bacterium]|jgi:dephospho-CoA kinase|nr:dephospho-CoA kinase [Bacteroidales bacterium]